MTTSATHPKLWRKRHNLTAWILQLLTSLAVAGLSIFTIVYWADSRRRAEPTVTGLTLLIYSLLTIALTIVEIVKFARGRLGTVLLLSFACVKTALWGGYFLQCLLAAAMGRVDIVMFPLSVVLTAASVSQLVVAAAVHKKRGAAAAAVMAHVVAKRHGSTDEAQKQQQQHQHQQGV